MVCTVTVCVRFVHYDISVSFSVEDYITIHHVVSLCRTTFIMFLLCSVLSLSLFLTERSATARARKLHEYCTCSSSSLGNKDPSTSHAVHLTCVLETCLDCRAFLNSSDMMRLENDTEKTHSCTCLRGAKPLQHIDKYITSPEKCFNATYCFPLWAYYINVIEKKWREAESYCIDVICDYFRHAAQTACKDIVDECRHFKQIHAISMIQLQQ